VRQDTPTIIQPIVNTVWVAESGKNRSEAATASCGGRWRPKVVLCDCNCPSIGGYFMGGGRWQHSCRVIRSPPKHSPKNLRRKAPYEDYGGVSATSGALCLQFERFLMMGGPDVPAKGRKEAMGVDRIRHRQNLGRHS
jgi:hypothetical protein